jgi:hypothetical protein
VFSTHPARKREIAEGEDEKGNKRERRERESPRVMFRVD